MRVAPALAGSDLHLQRHRQRQDRLGGGGHHAADHGAGGFGLVLGCLEDEFVMDLERACASSRA